ncbi:MAG TPA: hypothetical protein VGX25_27045 [Actinophytocola sp.]|uniref:hypothetical protein n=1 Tax=Actinophytocola sp. TaxID=1872138 RepID=UPI002DDD6736|nr:hypothetical protein [Actinophytocola sp.]HEV2783055.1 hypothetical protein [Actinophytocola sp.]
MELAGLVIGAVGTVVSVLALFYAAMAAKRSDALLRRLVVYPFRELDIQYAKLTEDERDALLDIYAHHADAYRSTGARPTNEAVEARPTDPALLQFLVAEGWLQRHGGVAYRLNPDRLPYLRFLEETEGKSNGR